MHCAALVSSDHVPMSVIMLQDPVRSCACALCTQGCSGRQLHQQQWGVEVGTACTAWHAAAAVQAADGTRGSAWDHVVCVTNNLHLQDSQQQLAKITPPCALISAHVVVVHMEQAIWLFE
jgi:hypothetical protein